MLQAIALRAKTDRGIIEHDISDVEFRSIMKALKNQKNMTLFSELKTYVCIVLGLGESDGDGGFRIDERKFAKWYEL